MSRMVEEVRVDKQKIENKLKRADLDREELKSELSRARRHIATVQNDTREAEKTISTFVHFCLLVVPFEPFIKFDVVRQQ